MSLIEDHPVNSDSSPAAFSISPALPSGLILNPDNGTISGTAQLPAQRTSHNVTFELDNEIYQYPISIVVDQALPDPLKWLAPGFNAEVIVSNASIPVRLASAPDGRIFYAELQTGQIRIVHLQLGLLSEPFAELDVVTGEEKGVIGLALDPNFEANGYVYVHATFASDEILQAKIIRFSDINNRGVNETVLVDNLPAADIHNGGDIVFGLDDHLFVGRGDITDPSTAQTSNNTAGKVLRYTREGGIPADNPFPGDPEWARGLRNTFALAVHPQTGALFGADAGPTSDDKLNYLAAGKNFLWGMETEPQGNGVGYSIRIWPEVITPTGLLFHSGQGGFSGYGQKLFASSYNFEDIRVIHLTGEAFTDFVREETFATMQSDNFNNKPLHLIEARDGSMLVSTFDTIFRISSSTLPGS